MSVSLYPTLPFAPANHQSVAGALPDEVLTGIRVAWLDDRGPRPDIAHEVRFHPMMLSNPIDEAVDFGKLDPADFSAEWKWDGIRVQLVLGNGPVAIVEPYTDFEDALAAQLEETGRQRVPADVPICRTEQPCLLLLLLFLSAREPLLQIFLADE